MATGNVHEIATIEDMVRLYASLPEERGELMLKEVADGIRMIAPLTELMEIAMPMRWIDSDAGEVTLRVAAEAGAEPFVTLKGKL